MKIQKLAAAACSCGRKHQIPIREIEIAPNLLSHLYQKLAGLGSWDKLLLVADENTWSAAGAQVEEALACRYALEGDLSAGFKPDERRRGHFILLCSPSDLFWQLAPARSRISCATLLQTY